MRARYEEAPEVQAEREHELEAQAAKDGAKQARLAEIEAKEAARKSAAEKLFFARTAVTALVYVAKADGRMEGPERSVIAAYVRSLAADHGIDLRWTNVHERVRKLICDKDEFLIGLKRLRAAPSELRLPLIKAAEALLSADGEIQPDEKRAAAWLKVMLEPT